MRREVIVIIKVERNDSVMTLFTRDVFVIKPICIINF